MRYSIIYKPKQRIFKKKNQLETAETWFMLIRYNKIHKDTKNTKK